MFIANKKRLTLPAYSINLLFDMQCERTRADDDQINGIVSLPSQAESQPLYRKVFCNRLYVRLLNMTAFQINIERKN